MSMSHAKEKARLEYWFALASVDGLGSIRIKRLIARFGSVANIFEAELAEIAQLPSFNPVLATRILTVSRKFSTLQEKLQTLNSQDIEVLCLEDRTYPAQLKAVPDAPAILCRVGKVSEVDERCVAIVGCRQPTSAGIQLTLELATYLVLSGFTVVSGLADGIDTNAHYAALAVDGKTVAVLPTDLSPKSFYPPTNSELAARICETGCLFSEHPFPTPLSPGNFILRNRIISGLSIATIVVESQKTGGAMHTARYARRQGCPVFACQWETQHEFSEGPRELINTGAQPFLLNEAANVVEALKHPELLEKQIDDVSSEQMTFFD